MSSFISNRYITENQLLQIAKNTFHINEGNPVQINQINAQKMLLALSFVINSKIKEMDPKSFENYIKRLMKNGTRETKEIYLHNFLSNYFIDYNLVLPLFSKNSDGLIYDNGQEIPVEIKTRNPEILTNLEELFNFITESLEEVFPKDRVVICNIKINRIEQSSNGEILCPGKHDFNMILEKIKNLQIPVYQDEFFEKLHSANIEMHIEITSNLQEPQSQFFMPEKLVQDCICYQSYTSSFSRQFFGGVHFVLTCSDDINNYLAKQIIEQCLKAKNIPSKGIVAIYFDTLTNEYLQNFIEKTAKNYVNTRKDIAILGITDKFDLQNKQIVGKMLAVGANIQELIERKQKHSNLPLIPENANKLE